MVQFRDIVQRQEQRFGLKQDKLPFKRAVLVDQYGQQTSADPINDVWAVANERRVWYMVDGAVQPAQCLCRRIPTPYVGLGVIIGYADNSNQLEVLSDDFFLTGTGDSSGWTSTGPGDLEPGGLAMMWIYTKVIVPLATIPGTGLAVTVIAGDYPYDGQRVTFPGSIDFALTNDPSANEHYYAGLYLDSSNTLQVVYGSSVSTAATAPDPTFPDGVFQLSQVLVDDVQTTINFDTDIVDRRMAWSSEDAGGWPFNNILTVSTTNPNADYSTIAAAITAASSGDVIMLDGETFTEQLTIAKSLTLVSLKISGTTITNSSSPTISATAGLVYFYNVNVVNTGSGATSYALSLTDASIVADNSSFTTNGSGTTTAGIYQNTGVGPTITLINSTVGGSGADQYGIYVNVGYRLYIYGGSITGTTNSIYGADTSVVELYNPKLSGAVSWAGTQRGAAFNSTGSLLSFSDFSYLAADDATQRVLNTSGGAAAAGDVGYLVYTASSGIEYKTTSTAADDKATRACVVVEGGANSADIKVATRGRFKVSYNSPPSQGDFLIFSSTAKAVDPSISGSATIMQPAVLGVAMAAGSGGVVDMLLLTRRAVIPFFSTNNLLQVTSQSSTDFVATQNGAPSGANITYNAPSSGNENTINPTASTELGKIVVHNTTRSTSAQLQATNTGTNVMTFTAAADVSGWQNGDTLTIRSQTNTDTISSAYFVDVAIDTGYAEIPALATAVFVHNSLTDTGAAGQLWRLHPWETGASSKRMNASTQVSALANYIYYHPISLINRRITYMVNASGSGTFSFIARVFAYEVAAP